MIQSGTKGYKTYINFARMVISSLQLRPTLGAFCVLCLFTLGANGSTLAQGDVGWWRGLFKGTHKSTCDSTSTKQPAPSSQGVMIWQGAPNQDSSNVVVETDLVITSTERPAGSAVEQYDKRIASLDSLWHTEDHALRGFRIQIFSGTLQAAREVRSKARRNNGKSSVYLSSMPPNYRVTIGDFRTRWEAQKAKDAWMKSFPMAIVIPIDINLPALKTSQTEHP